MSDMTSEDMMPEPSLNRIADVILEDRNADKISPDVARERKVAQRDLLEDNSFALPAKEGRNPASGPFVLTLGIRERRLFFGVASLDGGELAQFYLSLGPFRQVVKDYFQICESYFDAVRSLPPAQIETIDMARRGIHNEGARVLRERLEGKAVLDVDTSRRLFTLICVLHFGGAQ